jgi:hypothetical protein
VSFARNTNLECTKLRCVRAGSCASEAHVCHSIYLGVESELRLPDVAVL